MAKVYTKAAKDKTFSMKDLMSSKFFNLNSDDRHFRNRLKNELKVLNAPNGSFDSQVLEILRLCNDAIDEKTKVFVTDSECEEFLELMLTGIDGANIESFLDRKSKNVKHRIFDAAKSLSIDYTVLDIHWRRILKPALSSHIKKTSFKTRLASFVIYKKAKTRTDVDISEVKKFVPDRHEEDLEKELKEMERQSAGLPLYRSLLRQPRKRLLHIFDKLVDAFEDFK